VIKMSLDLCKRCLEDYATIIDHQVNAELAIEALIEGRENVKNAIETIYWSLDSIKAAYDDGCLSEKEYIYLSIAYDTVGRIINEGRFNDAYYAFQDIMSQFRDADKILGNIIKFCRT